MLLPKQRKAKAATSAKKLRATRERDPTKKQLGLIGEEFEDEGIEWKVLDVAWSEEHEIIVVYYYEVGSIDAAEIEQIKATADYGHESVEHSQVSEVVKWIRQSDSD